MAMNPGDCDGANTSNSSTCTVPALARMPRFAESAQVRAIAFIRRLLQISTCAEGLAAPGHDDYTRVEIGGEIGVAGGNVIEKLIRAGIARLGRIQPDVDDFSFSSSGLKFATEAVTSFSRFQTLSWWAYQTLSWES